MVKSVQKVSFLRPVIGALFNPLDARPSCKQNSALVMRVSDIPTIAACGIYVFVMSTMQTILR